MNKTSALLSFALVFGTSAFAQTASNSSATKIYVQPSLWIASLGSDFENGTGGSIAVGTQFKEKHQLELEVGRFDADVKQSPFSMEFLPVLLSYKYNFSITDRATFYVGGTAGAVSQKVDFGGYGPGSGETKSSATFGANVGFRYSFNDTFALDTGLKALSLQETRYTTSGSMSIWHIGVSARF